jgi:hypothetical protein
VAGGGTLRLAVLGARGPNATSYGSVWTNSWSARGSSADLGNGASNLGTSLVECSDNTISTRSPTLVHSSGSTRTTSLAGAAVAAPNTRGRNMGEGLDTIGGKFLAKGGGRGGILNCGLGKGSGVGLVREAQATVGHP